MSTNIGELSNESFYTGFSIDAWKVSQSICAKYTMDLSALTASGDISISNNITIGFFFENYLFVNAYGYWLNCSVGYFSNKTNDSNHIIRDGVNYVELGAATTYSLYAKDYLSICCVSNKESQNSTLAEHLSQHLFVADNYVKRKNIDETIEAKGGLATLYRHVPELAIFHKAFARKDQRDLGENLEFINDNLVAHDIKFSTTSSINIKSQKLICFVADEQQNDHNTYTKISNPDAQNLAEDGNQELAFVHISPTEIFLYGKNKVLLETQNHSNFLLDGESNAIKLGVESVQENQIQVTNEQIIVKVDSREILKMTSDATVMLTNLRIAPTQKKVEFGKNIFSMPIIQLQNAEHLGE